MRSEPPAFRTGRLDHVHIRVPDRNRGQTILALFEAGDGLPMVPQQTGVAFSIDAEKIINSLHSTRWSFSLGPGPMGNGTSPDASVCCWPDVGRAVVHGTTTSTGSEAR